MKTKEKAQNIFESGMFHYRSMKSFKSIHLAKKVAALRTALLALLPREAMPIAALHGRGTWNHLEA
jgi:hypothetical protein